MALESLQVELDRVDEPHAADKYSQALSQVASQGKPSIHRKNGFVPAVRCNSRADCHAAIKHGP